ncbi:hypothetical protein I5M27_01540 [Adhaeribacter sp. BT258]|uniref:Uncharacterized protein n=1 Tax=Adhaeribacter terrigena TaxID=2793070 RepID=A0ABS1BXM8_9BACT|nr:DUF6157 family protein [Adhaeribacter terrigena]MBK0401647.1 hypothetical protein [Adhaeribacter terrigena]
MSYKNAFVKVSEDCPVTVAEIPVAKNGKRPAHFIQYEILTRNPYRFGHEELIWEVYVQQKEIPKEVLETEGEEIKAQLFSKGHPCMRASALVKRYGFGAHYDEAGKIAVYPLGSSEYQQLLAQENVKVLPGMRSKKA